MDNYIRVFDNVIEDSLCDAMIKKFEDIPKEQIKSWENDIINFEIPKSVKIECPKQNIIKLTSINKEELGATAAKIRSYRKPEPFKGKGIKYEDDFIFRKEGKKK